MEGGYGRRRATRVCRAQHHGALSFLKLTTSKYWILDTPSRRNEHDDALINGSANAVYRLPGVVCPSCDDTWAGRRVLPHRCPDCCKDSSLLAKRQPVSLARFQTLADSIEVELAGKGDQVKIAPGDSLQPIVARVVGEPSPHQFYWTSIGYPIVGEAVKNAVEKEGCGGASLLPLSTFTGSPASGERPSDILYEPFELSRFDPRWTESTQTLYLLLVTSESGMPHGSRVIDSCAACGRIEIEHAEKPWSLSASNLPDADIFFIKGTTIPVVNERMSFLRSFDNVRLSNLRVSQ